MYEDYDDEEEFELYGDEDAENEVDTEDTQGGETGPIDTRPVIPETKPVEPETRPDEIDGQG